MQIQYVISFQGQRLFIKLLQEGFARRVLYWDTLSAIAKAQDLEALAFFKKLLMRSHRNLETLSFQQIEIPIADRFLAMSLIAPTKRVLYEGKPLHCDWVCKAELYWKGDDTDRFTAFVKYSDQEIPIESCSHVFPGWCIWKDNAFAFESNISWNWIEPFLNGRIVLEGVRKKRFLEENPKIIWKEAIPKLVLSDPNGCFANLSFPNPDWEKDLIEAGYIRKDLGNTHYFASLDRVRNALLLLIDVGWEVVSADGRKLQRQTGSEWKVREENGEIAISGHALFGEKKGVLQKKSFLIEIDAEHVGLLDPAKGEALVDEMEGEPCIAKWDAAILFPLLDQLQVDWEPSILETVQGLKEGMKREIALPGSRFQGTLLPHQQKGVDWLAFLYQRRFSALLADEMGLGKTVQVLAFFSRLRTNLPILIVTPSSLLFHWKSEILKFLPDANIYLHTGCSRKTELPEIEYVVTSYALLRIDLELFSAKQWEVIVLDESGAIKTSDTQTAKAAFSLKAHFKIALNGTPIENRPEELASQFQFLMPGLIQDIRVDSLKTRPFLLKRKKDELALPEKLEQTVWVPMEGPQEELYHAYVQQVRSKLLEKIAADGFSTHRMEVLEAILRLRQIAADPRLIGQELRGAKIDRIMADLAEAVSSRRKVLVYSQFTSMLALIAKELTCPFVYLDGSVPPEDRAERVRQFQEDPEMPLFLLSLKAGGVGLNLTAADYVLLFDPWWNVAVENQAIDRAHRIGRTQTVIAKRYLVLNSIEEKMLQLKIEKEKTASAFLDHGSHANWAEEDWLHLLS